MKEILKRYQRQFQIAGGICLIFVLGVIGYRMINADAQISSGIQKKDCTVTKIVEKEKMVLEREQDSIKNKEQRKELSPLEKSDQSEERVTESVKEEKETGKTESSSKPEQKPSQPESKPEQNPSKPQTKPESKPEQKPSKPQHTHTWKEVTHTINHEEVGHNEQYVIKEAWTETVTEEIYDPWECCNVCGADCTADPSGHMKQHALAGEGGGRHTEYYKTVTRTVEHPAEYGNRWVVDQPAWTETVSDGFFCSGCGTKK